MYRCPGLRPDSLVGWNAAVRQVVRADSAKHSKSLLISGSAQNY